jgi:hypothetical protein
MLFYLNIVSLFLVTEAKTIFGSEYNILFTIQYQLAGIKPRTEAEPSFLMKVSFLLIR